VETLLVLFPACYLRNNSLSKSRTINYVGRLIVYCLFPYGETTTRDSHLFLLQDFVPLWSRNGWASVTFRIVTFDFSGCLVLTVFFRSAINAPTTGDTYAAYLTGAKALGSSEPAVSCSLVPLGLFQCTLLFFFGRFSDFQHRRDVGWCGGYTRFSLFERDNFDIKCTQCTETQYYIPSIDIQYGCVETQFILIPELPCY